MAVSLNLSASGQSSNSATVTCTLTAVPQDDVIVVAVNGEATGAQGSFVVSSVTATGLTFTQRASEDAPGARQRTETWWAVVPSGGFTGLITATFSHGIDDATIHAFSVTGADTASPFGGGSAAVVTGSGTDVQGTVSAAAGTFVFVAAGSWANPLFYTTPVSGFANISTQHNVGAANYETSAVEYQVPSSTLSGATVGWTGNATTFWSLIADVIVPSGGVTAALAASASLAAAATVTESAVVAESATTGEVVTTGQLASAAEAASASLVVSATRTQSAAVAEAATAALSVSATRVVSGVVAMGATAGLEPNTIHATPAAMAAVAAMVVAGALPRPVNDNFARAYDLTSLGSGAVVGTNVNATLESGEPHVARGNSVWWKFIASADGYMTFNTFGSADLQGDVLDTVLSVYTGTAVNALSLVARSLDAGDSTDSPAVTSEVIFRVFAGVTYHVQVETADGVNPGNGTIVLRWLSTSGPPNDDFAAATALATPVGSVDGTTVGATMQDGEPTDTEVVANSVWYRFVATQDGTYDFDIASPGDVILEAWSGDGLTDLEPPPPPGNDVFAGATELTGISGSTDDNLDGATLEAGEPDLTPVPTTDWVGVDGGVSGYYTGAWAKLYHLVTTADLPAGSIWNPPAVAGDNRTDDTGFFQELDLYVGDPLDIMHPGYGGSAAWDGSSNFVTWTGVGSDGTPDSDSPLAADIPAGTDVWLVAVQYPDGTFHLPLDPAVAWDPATDSGSWTLSDGTTPVTPWSGGDLDPVLVGNTGTQSRWYKWTAPATYSVELHTLFGYHGLVIEAYTGTDLASLTPVDFETLAFLPAEVTALPAMGDVRFDVVSGTTYYIRVSNCNPLDDFGTYTLEWNQFISSPSRLWADAPDLSLLGSGGTFVFYPDSSGGVEVGEPDVDTVGSGVTGTSTRWWKWTAPANATADLHAYSGNGRLILDVWTGTAVDDLTFVAAGDDGGSPQHAVFTAVAGTTYYLRTNWYAPGSFGYSQFTWTLT